MSSINIGNKIENLDINDQTYFAFVKIGEALRYVFEPKMNYESMQIIRRDFEEMKL